MKIFTATYRFQKMSLLISLDLHGPLLFSLPNSLGTEFLPELDEGALWVESELPMSASLPQAIEIVQQND